jgi:hypothetical protein
MRRQNILFWIVGSGPMKSRLFLSAASIAAATVAGAVLAHAMDLDLAVGNPDKMPIAIVGSVGQPDERDLDLTIGARENKQPQVSMEPTDGLLLEVFIPGAPCL